MLRPAILRSAWRLSALCFLVSVAGFPFAVADIVTMNDGRVFEGTLRAQPDGSLQLDTVIGGIQATLTLSAQDIKSMEKKTVDRSAEDEAAIDPGIPATPTRPDEVVLYLEVPIKGRFGDQVFAQAVRSTLARAKLQKIKHIVFTVDSTGGPADEAGAIYRSLRQFEDDITYHAIVANCSGEALVIPCVCRTIHLQPGATIGGLSQKLENLPAKFAKKDEEVVRAQIADEMAEVARERGRRGEVIKAMVDPTLALAAWVDEKGEVELGRKAPANLPDDRLIFANPPGQVLTLSFEQATRLGAPTIKGGPEALGALLGFANWREESSYGRDTMNKAIAAKKRRENNAQSQFEDAVARNIRMRDTTSRAIQSNLKQAASWNPTTASYNKLSIYWNTVWWDPTQEWNTNLWTPESRAKWQSRSDACAYFLLKARDGINAMMRLDKEAVSLSLSPSFKPGDLSTMLDDVNVKLQMLSVGRNRIGE